MIELLISPAAISFLSQVILSLAATVTLLALQRQARDVETALLAATFSAFTVFLALSLLDAASPPAQRLTFVFFQNAALGVALVFLVQFAYRLLPSTPHRPWEAAVALVVTLAYALLETRFALVRQSRFVQGEVLFRAPEMDYLLLATFAWAPLVLLRAFLAQVRAENRPSLWRAILYPHTRPARAVGAIFGASVAAVALVLVEILRSANLLPTNLARAMISMGTLFTIYIFCISYLEYRAERLRLVTRLGGSVLTVLLALFGVIGWVVVPVHAATFVPDVPRHRTLHFIPNARGGYVVTSGPAEFENDLGERLSLAEPRRTPRGSTPRPGDCSDAIAFPFRFFGRDYSHVYVCNDGTVGLDEPLKFHNYQAMGRRSPMLMALLTNLDSDASTGGVFANQGESHLVVTWYRMRGVHRPDAEYTVQLVLHSSGAFDIVYPQLFAPGDPALAYHPNDDPAASIWAIGVLPGRASTPLSPVQVSFNRTPLYIGPEGAVHDFAREFLHHQNDLMMPLAWLVLLSSVVVIVGVPLHLRSHVGKPLAALLAGVHRLDEGKLDVCVPVRSRDEIGYLTQSFNTMASWLSSLINSLEERVAQRTAALAAANDELGRSLEEIRQLHSRLREEAIRDPLTCLLNRRVLDETLDGQLAQATRSRWSVSLLMIDIDHFKEVNDRLGHATGDALLRLVGQVLLGTLRRSDFAYRYGGDEFLIVLPNSPREAAEQVTENLALAFAASLPEPVKALHPSPGLSFGIAVFPEDGESPAQLLEVADRAMYQAKRLHHSVRPPAGLKT